MFAIATVVATMFAIYRWWAFSETKLGAWIADATSCWSAMILAVLSVSAFTRSVPLFPKVQIPSEIELIVSNGPLIPFAFAYCALILLRNLLSEFLPLLDRWRRNGGRPLSAESSAES